MTIHDYVRTLNDASTLKTLIEEIKGRYTPIGYKGKQSDREQEVRHIFLRSTKWERPMVVHITPTISSKKLKRH
jgi:hypothetical protein